MADVSEQSIIVFFLYLYSLSNKSENYLKTLLHNNQTKTNIHNKNKGQKLFSEKKGKKTNKKLCSIHTKFRRCTCLIKYTSNNLEKRTRSVSTRKRNSKRYVFKQQRTTNWRGRFLKTWNKSHLFQFPGLTISVK